MIAAREPAQHQITIKGKQLEKVREFKYLGSIISSDGKINSEINSRMSSGSRLSYALKTKIIGKAEISKKVKTTIIKNTSVAVLTYRAENLGFNWESSKLSLSYRDEIP